MVREHVKGKVSCLLEISCFAYSFRQFWALYWTTRITADISFGNSVNGINLDSTMNGARIGLQLALLLDQLAAGIVHKHLSTS